MSIIPHFERTTRNSTISHFLLMLGYKLFSFYFPIFLLTKGLSLSKIGFIYLLIYLPIAVFSPLVGAISHKFNPYILIICGIFGYSLYSLGMLFLPISFAFYFLQVMLGISASLFFVGNRIILISSPLAKPARSFGWFYSASYYAAELAPLLGAVIIFLYGLKSVFILSIFIYLIDIIFTFFNLKKSEFSNYLKTSFRESLSNFLSTSKKLFQPQIFPIVLVSFLVLFVGGFYSSFFLIFLKENGWTQNTILTYSSLSSLLFLPISFIGLHILSNKTSLKNILMGSLSFGIFSLLIGWFGIFLGFIGILILSELLELGNFISSSARSGFVSRIFSSHPREAGALDTIFSPLGTALGSLVGGLLVGYVGYSGIFVFGGILILFLALSLSFRLTQRIN